MVLSANCWLIKDSQQYTCKPLIYQVFVTTVYLQTVNLSRIHNGKPLNRRWLIKYDRLFLIYLRNTCWKLLMLIFTFKKYLHTIFLNRVGKRISRNTCDIIRVEFTQYASENFNHSRDIHWVYCSWWSVKSLKRIVVNWDCSCLWKVTWKYAHSPFNI